MVKRSVSVVCAWVLLAAFLIGPSQAQEDKMVQAAIDAVKAQMRVPKDIQIKFVEKKESPIPEFYSIKLILSTPDRDIPVVAYVDQSGEKVIIGNLIVGGENVTQKEAGQPKLKKIDMAVLEPEKSPSRGSAQAKATVVEFSNFQCPYCLKSWTSMRDLMEKRSGDIKYVFKHFPLQGQGKSFEISEMVAAAQEVSSEAFWFVHDFFFTPEGQSLLKSDREVIKKKIEEMVKERGGDGNLFLNALESGKGKDRVNEDISLGKKLRIRATPAAYMNGEPVRIPVTEHVLDQQLRK